MEFTGRTIRLLTVFCLLFHVFALSPRQPADKPAKKPADSNQNVIDKLRLPDKVYATAPKFHQNCNSSKYLTCHRERYKVLWHSHYIVGVDKYCYSPGSCWDVHQGLGRRGERFIAQLRGEFACTETFFRFHQGGASNKNIEKGIVDAGYDWVISFASPVGCGGKQVRNILNRCGVPWENIPFNGTKAS